jgi:hypothetical protein
MNELPETTRPSREPRKREKASLSCAAVACTLFLLGFLPAASRAQVATHSLYQGQLTDAVGVPRTGPVNLRLHLYAAESGGAPLYSEDHGAVALDAQGMFAVSLGGGSVLSGSYDAALLERPPLYLELVVEPSGENVTLSPRQRLGAVPSARVSGEPVRFEDCGDGTIADHKTGLLWERKNGPLFDFGNRCSDPAGPGCPDLHYSNNTYSWSATGTAPDGEVFTDFLARLNGDPTVVAATREEAQGDPGADPTVCLAHHCDWRLPTVAEQRTIVAGPNAAPGQPSTCPAVLNCADPTFAGFHEGGRATLGWSASTSIQPDIALFWDTRFGAFPSSSQNGNAGTQKTNHTIARAVRSGRCHRTRVQGS